MFAIAFEGQLTVVLAWRYASALRGVGGWTNRSGDQSLTTFSATVSGEQITYGEATNIVHYDDGNHSGATKLTVQEIIGIV